MKQFKLHFILVWLMLSATSFAQSGTIGSLSWSIDEGTLIISGNGVMPDNQKNIPWKPYTNSIKKVVIENGVTTIGAEAFLFCGKLTSIIIPESVTSIGMSAFNRCKKLSSVEIPNSVTNIGANAFLLCESLTSISIPSNVTNIGSSAFAYCSNLTSINVNSGNAAYSSENGVLYNKNKTTLIRCPEGKTGSYVIPNSVTIINTWAFDNCKGLTSITIPISVTNIGEQVFSNCSGLTSITIPNSVTSIGKWAFADCWRLTAINIPNSIVNIGEGAFSNCSNLTSFKIPDLVTSIEYNTFGRCRKLTSVAIHNFVTNIGISAFESCENLTAITIPSSITNIERDAFRSCSNLTTVNFNAENCIVMGSCSRPVFWGCNKLKFLNIGSNVVKIPDYAFCGCSSLTSVTGAESVKDIGKSAFNGCINLLFNNLLEKVIYAVWEQTMKDNKLSRYHEFIESYPRSKYVSEVKQRIEEIENQRLTLTLFEAIEKKYVLFSAWGKNIESSNIEIKNVSELNLNLTIPLGTYLGANSNSYQNMILTKAQNIVLDAENTVKSTVSTACMNMYRSIPKSSNDFGITQLPDNDLRTKVIKELNRGNYSFRIIQAAIWIVTDNASYEAMGTLKNNDGTRVINNQDYTAASAIVNRARNTE